ncbi:putative uncharacterized protein [Clostridium sp. CAG:411]|nr:hypothetical protein [Lachnospiraceae bacterium]CDE47358.1 putative uncharacterized protein [Clostridium sp. CAG:411]
MGQCKICGKEIAEGQDICESCQKDMDQVQVDVSDLDDLNLDDIELDDYDLPELSGDLLETNLEFDLEDASNNLENPDIVVREKESAESEQTEEVPLTDTVDMAEIAAEEIPSVPDTEEIASEEISPIPDIEEIDNDIPSTMDEMAADSDIPDMDLDGLLDGTDEIKQETAEEQPAVEESALDGIDALLDSNDTGEMDLSDLLSDTAVPADEDKTEELPDTPTEKIDSTIDALGLGDLGLDLDLGMDVSDMSLDLGDAMDAGSGALDSDIAMMEDLPDAEVMAEMAEPKEKVSIWKRLFGNVKDEKWEKQKEKEAQEEQARLAKEEERKAKEKEAESEAENAEEGEKLDPKEAKKAAKLAKKEEKARKKAEKKAQKEQQKELIDEDEEEGRINRAGAVIVFVFLGMVATFIIVGTNVFSYKNSISRAKNYFKEDQYSQAYGELNGLHIKKKDEKLYEQVRTVMYVDKELNSYRNYTNIRMYPEALDSLLKGLEKYDYYIDRAREAEVTEDYDKLKNKILSELKKEYNMTEKNAYDLLNNQDQYDYSQKVIKIANE